MRLSFDSCELAVERRELRRDGQVVEIQRQVFDVLLLLVMNRQRVVTKDELLDEIWGSRYVSESALTTRIKEARRAVGDDGRNQRLIKTVHGVGYRFVGEVREQAAPDDRAPEPAAGLPSRPVAEAVARSVAPPRTYYANSGGASIAYQTFGSGPDLVLVNGFATNVEVQWEHPAIAAFLTRLGAFARVTVFDKRAMGCSERTSADEVPSLEVRVDDLRAVFDAAGIDHATVLGTSEGGSLAVLFAATNPGRVDRLILHGTWVRGREWIEGELDVIAEHWGKGVVYRTLCPTLGATTSGREFLARYERQSASPRVARALVEMIREINIEGLLPSIRVPTLIVHRCDDDIVPVSHARRLHELIAGSVLVTPSGSDHGVFSGDLDPIVDAVAQFLTGSTTVGETNRHVATVVFIDLVDSTSTLSEVGDAAWQRRLDDFQAITRRAVDEGGEIVNVMGDGVLVLFDGPGRAIRAVSQIRDELGSVGLRARSGIHTAEVNRRGRDVSGIGVHIASRIASNAGPGEILVSRTVTDLVAGNGLTFEARGSMQLKGIPQPWDVYSVVG